MTIDENIPSHDNDEIQSIPWISKICLFTDDTHGNDFDTHFEKEKYEDDIIDNLQRLTTESVTFMNDGFMFVMNTWLMHAKCDTID